MSVQIKRGALVVGIDLGGTNMQIGVVDHRHRIIGREGRKTKAKEGAERVIARMAKGVRAACKEADVKLSDVSAIGIASAGAIDIPRGVVLESPNLGWHDLPLRERLESELHRPVVVDNDVNGAVWGEYQLGAGRDRGDTLGVWVGTGIGGGLVLNQRLYYGDFFTAGEIGHTIITPDGPDGAQTVEDHCSRTGMARAIFEGIRNETTSVVYEITGGTGRITGSKQLAQAWEQGDRVAIEVIERAAHLLGIAIANWVTVLAIDTVILGGGVTEALGAKYVKKIRKSFDRHVFPERCRACKLLPTKLESDAGLLGAALLARARLQAEEVPVSAPASPRRR